jgi:hypothetical protein
MMSAAPPALMRIQTGLFLWIGFFAGWTLVSVPLTLIGAPFATLAFAGIAGVAAMVLVWRTRDRIGQACQTTCTATPGPAWPSGRLRLATAIAAALVFAAAAAVFVKTSDATALWVTCLGLCLISLLWSPAPVQIAPSTATPATPRLGLGFAVLSVVICGLYIVVLRPDADDAFYLNLPIGLKTAAHGMMVADTMYGLPDWPILGSNYRIEALPTLVAGLSWLTGLSVLTVGHAVLPLIWCLCLAATLCTIGYGLFRHDWHVFAAIFILAGLAIAGTLQNWGVHGIFRFFHGKGALLNIIVPLTFFIVLQHDRRAVPSRVAVAILGLLQLAGLGLTANAVYIAPLALGLSVAAVTLVTPTDLWRNAKLMVAVAPPLAAGLFLFLFDRPTSNQHLATQVIRDLGIWDMANAKYLLAVLLGLLFAAALAGLAARRNRWVSAYLLAALVFVINPYLWPYYARFVTGDLNFRLYWAIPVPMFIAMGATAVIMRRDRIVSGAVWVLCLGLVAMPLGIFRSEGSTIKPTLLKVPLAAFAVARAATAQVTPDRSILAPEAISAWLAIAEGHARPVFTRRLYLDQSAPVVASARLAPHMMLADWINAVVIPPDDEVAAAMRALCVGVVVRPANGPDNFDSVMALIDGSPVADLQGYRVFRTSLDCPS